MNETPGSTGAWKIASQPVEPRATRIVGQWDNRNAFEIWMGGTDSFLGEPMTMEGIDNAHIVDLAGDLPASFRQRARYYTPRVFMDAEVVPFAYPRLAALVHEIADSLTGEAANESPCPGEIARIYILCQYGMNRSGLLTGLLLRALGESAESAVRLIRESRPGALSNQTFVRLIEQWRCPEGAAG